MSGSRPTITGLVDEWTGIVAAFLRENPPGRALDPVRLEELLTRRESLLAALDEQRAEIAQDGPLAARTFELEQELIRRVEDDLLRRRQELDDVGRARKALDSYRGPRDDERNRGRISRYFDSRS